MPSAPERRVLDRPAAEILRPAALWVLPVAERAAALSAEENPTDDRVRAALAATRAFAEGARRGKELRTTAWAAHKAASESPVPAQKAAARAVSLAASVAYMHLDLVDANQLKHVLGPVVYTAHAFELQADGDETVGTRILQQSSASVTDEVRELVSSMPPLPQTRTRLSRLYATLDSLIRLP